MTMTLRAVPVRRKYVVGHCQDCGRRMRVTVVRFWASGMHYTVCADCIRPYRRVITREVRYVQAD